MSRDRPTIKELTGYSNISWVNRTAVTYFKAELYVDGKRIYIGQYKSLQDAVNARNAYIIEHKLDHLYNVEPWCD